MTSPYFYKKKVINFELDKGIAEVNASYRLSCGPDAEQHVFLEMIDAFCDDPRVVEINSLIIGLWPFGDSSAFIVKKLLERKEYLQHIEALYIGDMSEEECDMSWIRQSNLESIFSAFPYLKFLQLRGGNGLSIGTAKHDMLESLVIHTSGMGTEVLSNLAVSDFPNLHELELWLGSYDYGFNGGLEDVIPLIQDGLFPNLTHLGLQNSSIADQIAIELSKQPLQESIQSLNLSMGVMTSEGFLPLLESGVLDKLKYLNVRNNYLDSETIQKMKNQLKTKHGVRLRCDGQKAVACNWRFVDVRE